MSHKKSVLQELQKSGTRVSRDSVPQKSVAQHCPTSVSYKNVSHKIVTQKCSTSVSHKGVPTKERPLSFPRGCLLQCPATRVSRKRVSRKSKRSTIVISVPRKSECLTRLCYKSVSYKSSLQGCRANVLLTRESYKSGPQECQAVFVCFFIFVSYPVSPCLCENSLQIGTIGTISDSFLLSGGVDGHA